MASDDVPPLDDERPVNAPTPVDDDDAGDDVDSDVEDYAAVYEAQTSRLRVYASLLRVTVPRIGERSHAESGLEPEIDTDVIGARNLALHAIYFDIRRIATGVTPTAEVG